MLLTQELSKFYRYTPMREGILCWYPFDKCSTALDLSHGALTELLFSRCEHVEKNINATYGQFDYIVIIDSDDYSLNSLKTLKEKLKPHGRLLMAFENPFAIRYWGGKRSSPTSYPYDSLFGRGSVPGKTEIQNRLLLAGFEGQKWYYPLTDHWFAREVYSESFLPDELLNQRFVPYFEDDMYLRFDERGLYREVIRGGAFEFMCGAYLVEARVKANDAPCPVDYAAVTAYREPSKRFATTIRNDGTVRKTPLHSDGRESTLRILRNHEELAALGINIIPTNLEEDYLVTPRLNQPTLWDYWAKKLLYGVFDESEMFRQFDELRRAIYKASAGGKCYWELVPANCFYDEKSDVLTFFDQEYYWDGISPDVALVRALLSLKYSSTFNSEPRSEKWLNRLISRYNLTKCWEEFVQIADEKMNGEVFGTGTDPLIAATERAAERVASVRRRVRFSSVPDKLIKMGFKRPAIYGYGRRGKDLHYILNSAGITVTAVFDKTLPKRTEADVFIVSVFDSEDIIKNLRNNIGVPIFTLEELLDERPK